MSYSLVVLFLWGETSNKVSGQALRTGTSATGTMTVRFEAGLWLGSLPCQNAVMMRTLLPCQRAGEECWIDREPSLMYNISVRPAAGLDDDGTLYWLSLKSSSDAQAKCEGRLSYTIVGLEIRNVSFHKVMVRLLGSRT